MPTSKFSFARVRDAIGASLGGGPRPRGRCTIVHGASGAGGGEGGEGRTPGSESGCTPGRAAEGTPGSVTVGGDWLRWSTRECRMSCRFVMASSCSALGARAVGPKVVWTAWRAWMSLSSVVTVGVCKLCGRNFTASLMMTARESRVRTR